MIKFTFFLWLIIALLFVLSFIGIVVPGIPDSIFLWIAFVVYYFFGGGSSLTYSFWAGMIFLTGLNLLSDYLTSAYFVKRYGGSKFAVLGAFAGLILGTVLLGPIGILFGPFLLVFIISYFEKKESSHAFRVSIATLAAIFSSTAAKIILQLIMITWFLVVVI